MFQRTLTVGVAAAALLFISACSTTTATAPSASTPAASESAGIAAISMQRLSDGIRTISADEYQGRVPGTPGEEMTLAWLQAQYEAMGLEPGGPNGQWTQRIDLKRYTPVAGAASASWKGRDGVNHPLTIGSDIAIRSVSNDGKAAIENAGLVFAGYGITAPERNWDDYGDIDVRGKVVVVIAGEPEGELFNGAYDTAYQSGAYKADEAFRRGAVGLITLNRAPGALQPNPRADGRRTMSPGAADLEFTGTVAQSVAAEWGTAAGVDHAAMGQTGSGNFKAVALTGVTLSVAQQETVDTLVTHNLLAKITGSERPNETIIFSAHWDHVGVNPNAPGTDKIWNGAWDNASGTVGVTEMAHAFAAGPKPKRTVVFAHMAAEEMGLLGSYAYTADPVYPLETTVADINIDMLPFSPPTKDIAIFGKGQNDLEDRLSRLAQAEGRYVTDDREPDQGYYYRSDHYPFARRGVPALMPWHGVDWVEGGKAQGEPFYQTYFRAHYHQAADEWTPQIDFRSAVENLQILYRLGDELANNREWPQWSANSEFGQVRQRSDSARR